MEIMKIIYELERPTQEFTAYKMGGEYAAAVQEAIRLLVQQGERIAELEEEKKTWETNVANLRNLWQKFSSATCQFCEQMDHSTKCNWIPTKVRKPEREYWENRLKYPASDLEVLVMIHGAAVPTCLYFNAEGRFYEIDMYENMEFYEVDYWALMPEAPKGVR